MQEGEIFLKESEGGGKSLDRTVFYQKGEMGGTLAWGTVGSEQIVQDKHSLPIHTITRVFEGQDDLTFTVVSTYRMLTLEAREAHTRDIFIHGLRSLLAQVKPPLLSLLSLLSIPSPFCGHALVPLC
jgi:hypothetical protein